MHKPWGSLAAALGFGVATQALFWDAPLGVNLAVFALLALAANGIVRAPSRAGWVLSAMALVSAGSIAVRASDWSLFLGVPVTAALLVCALASPAAVSDLPMAVARFFGRVPGGSLDAARTLPAAVGAEARPLVVRGLLGIGIGLPVAAVFGGLLASDESFRLTVFGATDRMGTAGGFAIASVGTAFGALVVFGAVKAVRALEVAPALGPYRVDGLAPIANARMARPTLSVFTWGVVLTQVALVFTVFAIANVRHLFGGVASIHADHSLTYASYLHSGFTELVLASSGSIGLVIVGHALVTPHGDRTVHGGRALAAVEAVLLALSALTLASCAQRLFIYEDAYGATYKRLGVLVVGLGVLGVLAVTALKSVRRGWSGWGGTAMFTVLTVLAGASLYDADGHVARTNLDRAAAGASLDRDYLASLGPDACSALHHPVVEKDDELRTRLRGEWTAPPSGLRSQRGFVRCR